MKLLHTTKFTRAATISLSTLSCWQCTYEFVTLIYKLEKQEFEDELFESIEKLFKEKLEHSCEILETKGMDLNDGECSNVLKRRIINSRTSNIH